MLNRLPRTARIFLLVLLSWQMAANMVAWAQCAYVDDDAPLDPGPNNPGVGDPFENGTQEHPFDSIQQALNFMLNPCEVKVMPGTTTKHSPSQVWAAR